ncbi:hypothetical protein [Flavobacterium sp. CF136]|uniref:hypothetical protein n=1 Tax=Flavobacterium sp. (strain CF136) TaxID=1144313 RepID=UPI0002719F07|nr:hypothetical protein [Flavobacterium sp. CF136]EJL66293.1 hypothetical protein PMI10_00641 [Flavobacterium sp. CF136]
MDADIQGCLNQIDRSYKAFQHNGKSLTKLEVQAVLEYGKAQGYKSVSEIKDSDVDDILNKVNKIKPIK